MDKNINKEKQMIKLSKSSIGVAEQTAVQKVLETQFLGMGQEVQKFEIELTKYFNRPVVCVTNGTAALHLALQACNIGPGDEVLVPSLTYVASFQAISATGATPIACDVDRDNLFIDLEDVKRKLTSRSKAIMPVFYASNTGDLNACYELAKTFKLRVIEDAAHAFGSCYKGNKIGSFGDISCFSFDGIKNITSGEGGCIVSDDDEIIQSVKDARLLGVTNDTEARYKKKRTWQFDVTKQGWRYHMSDIMAAIGLAQLKKFKTLSKKRQNLAQLYSELLSPQNLINPLILCFKDIVPHIYVVRIEKLIDREGLRSKMLENGIETGIHYIPNHKHSLFRNTKISRLEVTETQFPILLTLPLHPDLLNRDIRKIVKVLLDIAPKFCKIND